MEVTDENGNVERVPVYRVTNRGAKGVKTMNITEKTGKLVAMKSVNDDNDLVIINKSGITIRLRVADIRVMGRATQGVRIINLEKRNDTIASVCCVDTDPEEAVEEVEESTDIVDESLLADDAEAQATDDNPSDGTLFDDEDLSDDNQDE